MNVFEAMGGERLAKGGAEREYRESGGEDGTADIPLEHRLTQMMAAALV